MRGWELVGGVEEDGRVSFFADVDDSDIIAVAPSNILPLRSQYVRARHARERQIRALIPLALPHDVVYRAVALGECAFTRPS